jgi:hypothetical protein
VGEKAAVLPLSPAETGVADKLVWQSGPEAGASAEWWTNEATLGRAPESTFVVDDASVSRRHARLTRTSEGVFLEDLGSGNGTRLDGVPVTTRVRLRDGGHVELGGVSFRFETLVTTVTAARPSRASSGAPRLRPVLLGLLALTSVAVAGAAAWKARRPSGPAEVDVAAREVAAQADVVARAQALVRDGRWSEARRLLAPVWANAEDPQTQARWAFVDAEAGHQRRLDEAAAKLKAESLAEVDTLLGEVPDGSAQVDRRDALRRERAQRSTPPPVAEVRPESIHPTTTTKSETRREPIRPAPAKATRVAEAGGALAAYLAGDTARAQQLSTETAFTGRVKALETAWQAGRSLAHAGNAAEAVRQLAVARRLDAEISQGRPGIIGPEAARLFAAQSFAVASALRSDDDLGRKAMRLADAVEADPQERYRSAQSETWARCRELYQQAYVSRGPAPDEARQWFRTVCKCLPAGDEKQARACAFAKQLGEAP